MKIVNILVFCFIIFLIFILATLENRLSFKYKKAILRFMSFLIAILCGVRVIGLDLEPYRVIFDSNGIVPLNLYFFQTMFTRSLEPFFVILISFIKQFGLGFKTFLFISAVIPMHMACSLILKKEKNVPIITFLFFLLLWLFRGPVDTIRHFFAVVIYLSAIYSLSENKKGKFYLKSLFSVLVHYSNITIFVIRPFLRKKWTVFNYLMTMVILIVITLILKPFVISYIAELNPTNQIVWKLKYYIIYNKERYVYLNVVHQIMFYLMTFTVVLFNIATNIAALLNKKLFEKDEFHKLLLNSQIIGTILVVVLTAMDATTLGLRLHFLFSIGNFFIVKQLLFSKFEKSAQQKTNQQFFFIMAVWFLCIYNFVIILYFAGIYDPNSPFSIV